MRSLIQELLPHAPKIGLFVAPEIPSKRLKGATRDYAKEIHQEDIIALYDGTFLGNGRDGAIFLDDRFVFQNSDLEPSQTVNYRDIVFVEAYQSRIRGSHIEIEVNRGRATFSVRLDLSKHPKSMQYIEKLLHQVMLAPETTESIQTDWDAVSDALDNLRSKGLLTESDFQRLLNLRSR
ncbi:MAG: hypothetical protein OXE59_04795 [Bacteroidetes bacterium]|nr:hypothetical protein [Bacteroidota bacterium]MCY4233042.1 hypothetical protein [Bacteroidota bacterium]